MNAKALSSLANIAVFGLLFAGCDTAPRDSDLDRNVVDRGAVQDCLTELDQCFGQIDGYDPEAFQACHEQVEACFDDADGPGGDGGRPPGGGDDGGRPPGDGGDDGGRPPGDGGDDGGRPPGDGGGDQSCSLSVSSATAGPDGSVEFSVECSKDPGAGVIECSRCETNGTEHPPFSIPAQNDRCGFDLDEVMAASDACVAQAD